MFWVQIFLSTEQENIGTLGTSEKIEMTEMSNSGGFCFSILPVTKLDKGLLLGLLSAFLRVFHGKIHVHQKHFSFPLAFKNLDFFVFWEFYTWLLSFIWHPLLPSPQLPPCPPNNSLSSSWLFPWLLLCCCYVFKADHLGLNSLLGSLSPKNNDFFFTYNFSSRVGTLYNFSYPHLHANWCHFAGLV